ncbi:hypothetical protein Tcan_07007 [Toxocara canis]|uniref:Uncharacterized protein n=1 Tax=Toxocara canis TaxID=6265 RepID=A0A0B2W0P7_TOXCA|nr:hypothetical protein Tcan_07007 [Toxocara canis]
MGIAGRKIGTTETAKRTFRSVQASNDSNRKSNDSIKKNHKKGKVVEKSEKFGGGSTILGFDDEQHNASTPSLVDSNGRIRIKIGHNEALNALRNHEKILEISRGDLLNDGILNDEFDIEKAL